MKSNPEGAGGGRKLALGAMASGAVNVTKAAIQIMLLPIMARLLGPGEFGLYALALPTITLIALLADGGLGMTLARDDESSSLVWSSAFWALLVMGIILAIGVSIFGIFLGRMTNQPLLSGMIALLSLSLVFLTLSVVPVARLTRRKNLAIIAGLDLGSTIIGAVIAVALAVAGAGAWSLAVQYVATFAVRAIALNFAAHHVPKAEFSFKVLRSHLVSGGIMVTSRICEFAGRTAENFLVDSAFGTAVLGKYTFANQISRYSTETGANVVWTALYVQALTGDRQKIAILHRQLSRLLSVVLFPATFLASAAAPELVDILLGPQWTDLAFLLRVLLPLYAFNAICSQSAPVLLAYGRFDIQFWCMLGLSVGRVLAVALGFWIGLEAVIYCLVFVTLLFSAAMLIIPADVTGCRPLPVLRGLISPALSSLAAVVAYLLMIKLLPPGVIWIIANLALALLVYAMCMLLIDRKNLSDDWNAIRKLIRPKNPD